MTVAFIGSDLFKWTERLTKRFNKNISKVVKRDGARTFLFTCEGNFELLCWVIVTRLKQKFPDIERVYARAKCEDDDGKPEYEELMYERTILLGSVGDDGTSAESVRNEAMVFGLETSLALGSKTNTRTSFVFLNKIIQSLIFV